jgi:type IV secretion system protein VirD4
VYVGGWEDQAGNFYYLRHNGPEHVLTYAPTRSGKGVGLVIPTLLSWPASAVITDLKGELWALTAGWRKQHARNKVLRFEPASNTGGVRWNPMDEIRLGTEYEVGDVQNLATLIVDPDGKGLESHWQKTAFALLVGVILHALYKAKNEGTPATLPAVDAMLADPNRAIAEVWMEMATYGHVDGQNHPAIGSAARDMMDRPEEEAGSVLSTAKSYLALYRDPVVARAVSKSEFRIKDLMNSDDPVSLYIVTQPNDKARLRPLVRVLVNTIVRLLADKLEFESGRPKATYKHRLLAMLDEFPSLGKLEILQESLAFVAGYGIKCYLICQDINQLKSRETGYGHDESITSNCHVQNAYPPNRIETAEHLSRLTGQTTVLKEQITTSGRRTSAMLGQVSRTIQEVQRPLLTPDECLRMPGPRKNDAGEIEQPGDMVIYVAGYPAIYGKQPLYFKDPVFQARAAIPAPKQSDKLRNVHDDAEAITI